MNRKTRFALAWVAASLAVFSPFSRAEDAVALLPLPPSQLWEIMPGNLRTWELKKSIAETRFRRWPEARAVREYEKRVPEEEGGENAKPPATTRIVVTDTGAFPDKVAFFGDFQPGKDENEERKVLEGFPAFVFPLGEGGTGVEMLVGGRFLIEITLRNQPEKYLREWLRRIDLKALAATPASEKVPLPETLRIYHLDQLEPEKNHGYRVATTSEARQEREAREDEEWLRQMVGEIPELEEPDGEIEPGEGPAAEVP